MPASAHAAEAVTSRGQAIFYLALMAVPFVLSVILPFTRDGWLRRVCEVALGVLAFGLFFFIGIAFFGVIMGKEGHFVIAAFAAAAPLAFLLVRHLRSRAQQQDKTSEPVSPFWEKPAAVGNPAYQKISSRITVYKSLGECCGIISVLFAALGIITLFHDKAYVPGARESLALQAMAMAFVLASLWFIFRQRVKKLTQMAPVLFWGGTKEEAQTAAQSEVQGDPSGGRSADMALDYARNHAAEIADYEKRFIARMTERHAVSPDAAAQMVRAQVGGRAISAAAVWHSEGREPEKKADTIAYVLNRTSAYDASIFPAAAGYSKPARHALWAVVTFVVVMYFVGRYGVRAFIPSPEWRAAGFWFSAAAGIAATLWLVWMQRSGKMPGRTDGKKPGAGTVLALAPALAFIFWMGTVAGIGVSMTALFGDTIPRSFTMYKSASATNCIVIEPTRTKLCLKKAAFDRLPESGTVTFPGRNSWFGFYIGH